MQNNGLAITLFPIITVSLLSPVALFGIKLEMAASFKEVNLTLLDFWGKIELEFTFFELHDFHINIFHQILIMFQTHSLF